MLAVLLETPFETGTVDIGGARVESLVDGEAFAVFGFKDDVAETKGTGLCWCIRVVDKLGLGDVVVSLGLSPLGSALSIEKADFKPIGQSRVDAKKIIVFRGNGVLVFEHFDGVCLATLGHVLPAAEFFENGFEFRTEASGRLIRLPWIKIG